MKLPLFDYAAPHDLGEALGLMAEHGDDAKMLAGGQSLLPLMAFRLARPAMLVDLVNVPGLNRILTEDGRVVVGSMTRERTAEQSATISANLPLLAQALPFIGHAAIRNQGTVGGSAAHADPSAEIPAVAVALDAEFVVTSAARGERVIGATEFFKSFFVTALEPDELMTEVRFPIMSQNMGVAFEEVARRHGDFAIVGAAVAVQVEDDVFTDARLALCGVSDTPVRCRDAEEVLIGLSAEPEAIADALASTLRALNPPSDLHGSSEYRLHLAQVISRRAIVRASARSAAPG